MNARLHVVPPAPEPEPPIRTEIEARTLVREFETAMDELLGLIQEETKLVRAGRLYAATDLTGRKTDLLGTYLKIRTRMKSQANLVARFLPEEVRRLRDGHDHSIEILRDNLAVLAIAREVAEGIVRNVSTIVGRQAAPKTYGRNAAIPVGRSLAARGISLDRSL